MMAKRRTRGEGSSWQRKEDGMYVADWYDSKGERRYCHSTKSEAAARRKAAARRVRPASASDSLAEHCTRWIEQVGPSLVALGKITESTVVTYTKRLRAHVIDSPHARIAAADFRVSNMRAVLADVAAAGAAPGTVAGVKAAVSKMLDGLVEDEELPDNVARKVTVRLPRGRRPVPPLTPPELMRLLDTAANHQLGPLLWVLATCGLRHGEVLALRWSDIAEDGRGLTIGRNHVRLYGRDTYNDTKGHRARFAALEDGTRKALAVHRERQDLARSFAGDAWSDHELIFTRADGCPLSQQQVRSSLEALCVDAGLPRLTPHDLRHLYATALANLGVGLATIQRVLGHSSLTTTQIYVAVNEDAAHKAADAFGHALRQDHP